MNMPRKLFCFVLTLGLIGVGATDVFSDDLPNRKPGLWEIKGHMEGMPDMGAVQECVDKDTDNILQQEQKEKGMECKPPVVKKAGDKITIHTECTLDEDLVVSNDYTLQGSLDSAYQGTVVSQMKSSANTGKTTFTFHARWMGPCKPGQKPGDVINP